MQARNPRRDSVIRGKEAFAVHRAGRTLCSLVVILVALGAAACGRRAFPPQPVVSEMKVSGTGETDAEDLLEGLATAESQRFLGIWDGIVFEYAIYDPELLAKDLERVERYMRARGYYEARVVAARTIPIDEHRVRVEIHISPGTVVRTGDISVQGLEQLPIATGAAALRAISLQSGERFDEARYEESKQAIQDVLLNAGYAFAKVDGRATVDVPRHVANVAFQVDPGRVARFGRVTILGLRQVPENRVRSTLNLERGDRYSQAELNDARRALVSLGVFANVRVVPELQAADGDSVPITILVQETKLRTVRVGGGAKLDALQLSTHLTFGWEHRNFLGGMRRFSIETKPGLVYFPTRFGDLKQPDRALFQNEIHSVLRQPSFLEARTTGFVSTDFNVYPLLYAETAEDEAIVGFAEVKASAGLERALWAHHLLLVPSYNWQLELPLDYRGLTLGRSPDADEDRLQDLVIVFPELVANLDFRDDPLDPRSGAFFSAGVQVASSTLGSDVSDLRLRPEARFYVPISKTVTFATRFAVGFLLPRDYGNAFSDDPADEGAASQSEVAIDQQKVLFRGFFSGGPNSNRGYPFRGVGPHGPVPFLSGDLCEQDSTLRICNRPLGGLSLWEGTAEVRFPIAGPLRGATFLDTSDVNRRIQLDFSAPHASAGLGLRYGTPIGPVRVDVGYRLPFAQDLTGEQEERPRETFGIPMAIHLSLGEAF